jgi:ubiquinone/menaquinone biosynthesis C-methylase UbiE
MHPFDSIVETYDAWYDTFGGQAVFNSELKCLRSLCTDCRGRWLEAGVGTARFASGMGIVYGIDPSLPMLRMAASRGVFVCAARAENLPFRNNLFDGVLLAVSLCFIPNPGRALEECRRILRPGGSLLLGIISGEGPWGLAYKRKKAQGHPIYSMARFSDISEITALAEKAGFTLKKAASSLFWKPGEAPEENPRITDGISADGGFIGLLYSMTAPESYKIMPSGDRQHQRHIS